jgi:hypothetical protein
MISKPTVFVLGAGASAPYGFPLGTALSDAIAVELLRDSDFRDDLLGANINVPILQQFARALRASGRYSIDEYLQGHPEYRDLGKLAIARILIPAERDDRLDFTADYRQWLPVGSPDTRWYRYNTMTCEVCQRRFSGGDDNDVAFLVSATLPSPEYFEAEGRLISSVWHRTCFAERYPDIPEPDPIWWTG